MRTLTARRAEVGGLTIRRALPQRGLRTVGPWCFADHMGPEVVTPTQGLDVGPHPHIGLHTATWLFDGAVVHTDSLGSEQLIRPGELNLMTAGHGIVHAEQADRVRSQRLHGIQLWLAQPDTTRDGPPAFTHAPVTEGELLAWEPRTQEMTLRSDAPARLVLLGGAPWGEPLFMWWNFVARSRSEIDQAITDWSAWGSCDRFGDLRSPLPAIAAPALP